MSVQRRRTNILQQSNVSSRGQDLAAKRQIRADQLQQKDQLNKISNEQDQILKNYTQNFQNFSQLQSYYDSLPPEVKSNMKLNPNQVRAQQKKTISQVQDEIKKVQQDLKREDERFRQERDPVRQDRIRLREDRLRGEIDGLKEGLKELEKGTFLDFRDVRRFSRDRGRFQEQKTKDFIQKRSVTENIVDQIKKGAGNVTAINYDNKGNVQNITVDGQKIELSSIPVKDRNKIQLTAVREANEKQRLARLEDVAKQGFNIRELKEKGFTNKEIGKIGRFETLNRVKDASQERKLTKNELSSLGLTQEQINILRNNNVTTQDLESVLTGNKEQQKRQLALLEDIKKRDQFFDKLEEETIKNAVESYINKLENPPKSPSELLGLWQDTRPIFQDTDLSNLRPDQRLNTELISRYNQARRNNKSAQASILGLAAFVSSGVTITADFGAFILDVSKLAYDTATNKEQRDKVVQSLAGFVKKTNQNDMRTNFNALKKLGIKGTNGVLSYFGEVGQNANRGDPFAAAELALLLFGVGLPVKSPKLSKAVKNTNGFGYQLVQRTKNKDIRLFDSTIDYKQSLTKGSGTISITTKGISTKGLPFSNEIKLSVQPKTRTLIGTSKTTVGKTSSTQNIQLIDRGVSYQIKGTNITIPKQSIETSNIRGKVKTLKSKITTTKDLKNLNFQGTLVIGEREKVISKLAKEGKKLKKIDITQRAVIEQALGVNKVGEFINEIARKGAVQTSIRSSINKLPNKRTPRDYDNIAKMFEAIQWDKNIINGIDRRTRLGYALGLNKRTLPATIKAFEKNIEEGYIIKRAGTSYSTATFSKLAPKRYTLGPSFYFNNLNRTFSQLKNSKKAQVRLSAVQKDPITTRLKKSPDGSIRTPQTIEVPRIESLLFLPQRLPAGTKIPARYRGSAVDMGLGARYGLTTANVQKQQLLTKQALKEVQIPKQVQTILQLKTPQEQIRIQRQMQKLIGKGKPITKSNLKLTIPKIPRIPRTRIKGIKKAPIAVPLPKLKAKNRKLINSRLGELNFVIRDSKTNRRRIIKVQTGLPFNEAKALGKEFVDNTILASFSIKPYGVNKKRASLTSVDLSKFRTKKGRDKLVRDLVEKRRFRLDRPNELQQISQARIRASIEEQAKKLRNFLNKKEQELKRNKK